jgi:hypothetical protein
MQMCDISLIFDPVLDGNSSTPLSKSTVPFTEPLKLFTTYATNVDVNKSYGFNMKFHFQRFISHGKNFLCVYNCVLWNRVVASNCWADDFTG